jgi:hypothetical protein
MISLQILQTFCTEAAELFGDDWAAMNRHIADKLESLRESDRRNLLAEVEKMLQTQIPDARTARRLQ